MCIGQQNKCAYSRAINKAKINHFHHTNILIYLTNMQTRPQQHTFTFRHFFASHWIAKGKHSTHRHTRKITRNSVQSINVKKIFKLWLRGHNRVWLMLLAIIIGIYLIRWNCFIFCDFFFSTALPRVCHTVAYVYIYWKCKCLRNSKNIFTSSLQTCDDPFCCTFLIAYRK